MFVLLQTLLTECCTFSTLHQRFICIHLLYPYLTMLLAQPFPKRSAPWLFTTAPYGGLMLSPVGQHRWVGSTIL